LCFLFCVFIFQLFREDSRCEEKMVGKRSSVWFITISDAKGRKRTGIFFFSVLVFFLFLFLFFLVCLGRSSVLFVSLFFFFVLFFFFFFFTLFFFARDSKTTFSSLLRVQTTGSLWGKERGSLLVFLCVGVFVFGVV